MFMLPDQIGIPTCFSSGGKTTTTHDSSSNPITRSGQNVYISVYRTKLADQCRLITVTWCKNLLLYGLSVLVQGPEVDSQFACKVELNPWYFWKKQGSKRFSVADKPVDVFWDLKAAKFNGETEPNTDYYVAVVCDEEVVLLLGNLKKEAYRKTGCRPALIDPILVSRKEHIFGKKKFFTRAKFHDKGSFHNISIECKNARVGVDPEMEIKIDGNLSVHVKHLQWNFRGNESIVVDNMQKIEVCWDAHDWLFVAGSRHASFVFRASLSSKEHRTGSSSMDGLDSIGWPEFRLFVYAWKVE